MLINIYYTKYQLKLPKWEVSIRNMNDITDTQFWYYSVTNIRNQNTGQITK